MSTPPRQPADPLRRRSAALSLRGSPGALLPSVLIGVLSIFGPAPAALGNQPQEPAEPAQTPAPPAPTAIQQPLSDAARKQAIDALDPEDLEWLRSVRGLISAAELDYFLRLGQPYRRAAFKEAFWQPRDPDPRTVKNELKERWQSYLNRAGGIPYQDPRFLLLLFNGPPGGWSLPDGRPVARCFARSQELEIWFYGNSERTDRQFPVILQRRVTDAPYEVFLPGGLLRPVIRTGGLPTTDVRQLCAEELLRYTQREIQRVSGYDQLLETVLSPPIPSLEWLANLASSGTDLPRGAATFEVTAELRYPARKQSRTAVEVMLGVTPDQAPGQTFDGQRFHNFQIVGEVIRDGRLFESFRYRFEGPTPETAILPLGFTRYLRSGPVELRILLEDLYGNRFAQVVREFEVPSPDGLPAIAARLAAPDHSGGPSLRLYPPSGNLQVGLVRFRAQATGELDKVTFYVDDRQVLSKRRPPYSAELDLGPDPVPRRVRVVGEVGGQEVATDQLWLNQGAQRFRVRLIEPRAGGIYPGSLTARAEVETPDGSSPERLELYVNDELVSTLTEPPFAGSLQLESSEVAVIQAVAFLADGSSTEDAVVINSSSFLEAVDVRLVELHALITDPEGRPIRGLDRDRFRVVEDGVAQTIQRFEPIGGAAFHAALLIDRSASMEPHLDQVRAAAGTFAETARQATAGALGAGRETAILSFADGLSLDAGFDAGVGAVERALAGLDALGGTALYDSLVQALNTFDGLGGPAALVLFTDGQDESSRLTFEQTREAARRAGVTVYAVALAAAFPERPARRRLQDLTADTGGRALFLDSLEGLEQIYGEILAEIGQRYLIAYASSGHGSDYRSVRLEVDVPRAEVRTRRGYYP